MNLSDVYCNQVKKGRINNFSTNSFSPVIEKDPVINQLEKNLAAKFQEIMPSQTIESPNKLDNLKINTVSVDDALKELIQITKKN
jgi:hypothetical protein